MQTPNFTQAQVASIVGVIVAIGSALAALPDDMRVPVLACATVVAVAWIIGDAVVRHGRSGIEAARVAAVATLPPDALDDAVHTVTKIVVPPDGDDTAHAPEA